MDKYAIFCVMRTCSDGGCDYYEVKKSEYASEIPKETQFSDDFSLNLTYPCMSFVEEILIL